MDSVLVANEVLEELKRKKNSCIFFKVNCEKAYESVRWEFIYYMLGRLGSLWKMNSLSKSMFRIIFDVSISVWEYNLGI